MRVKICGITCREDAQFALAAGADAIGINLYPGSKRYLDLPLAVAWLSELPRELKVVAVMVNPTREEALRIARLPFVEGLQLHGSETPEFCRALAEEGVRFAKALPVTDGKSLGSALRYATDTLVLDAQSGGEFGGTGKTFPWRFAGEFAAENPDARIVLAGGLSPDNVAEAVKAVRPFAVDVTTGVELSPGRKDHGKIRAFIVAALEA